MLAPLVRRTLSPEGWAFFEIGAGQAEPVAQIMTAGGLHVVGTRRDLAGYERCVVLRLKQKSADRP